MRAAVASMVLTCAAAAVASPASTASSRRAARVRVGAATVNFTPPKAGELRNDPADCDPSGTFRGRRKVAFEESYKDLQGSGHYDSGGPYVDCNGNGRWEDNLLGGGSDSPRFYDHVADDVGARALAVSNGNRTIAVEVLDNEGRSTSTSSGSGSAWRPTASTCGYFDKRGKRVWLDVFGNPGAAR